MTIWRAAVFGLGLVACGGGTSHDAAHREPTFEGLLESTCQFANDCQCWPEASRQTCREWVGTDFALLQQLAQAQSWTFHPECIQAELDVYKELDCRATVSNEALEELLTAIGCKYYSGSATEGEPCAVDFDCTGDDWCNRDEGVCVRRSTVGTEGGECLPQEQGGCGGRGTLWCDAREPAPGVCRAAGKAGDACLIDLTQADGTTGTLLANCTSDNYCDEASRTCMRAPQAGEPCAAVYRLHSKQCAPDHSCHVDGLCHRRPVIGTPGTEGGALSCNFTDEPNIPGRVEYRVPMPLSRRELARVVRDDGYGAE